MNTLWRRLLVVGLSVGLVATACSDDEGDGDSADSTTAPADGDAASLDLITEGTLTVCSDIPYAPFEFEDEANPGEFTGFDVEVVEAIAGELDLTVEWKDSVFDTILASLASGDCDMVASALTITDERKEQVDFTDPYFDSTQSLLVRAEDAQTFATLEDLAGETIGVQAGTTGETYTEENLPEGATVKAYEGGEDLFLPLQAGEIAAVLQDLPVNGYRSTQDDQFVVSDTFGTAEQYGFAVEKGNAGLLEAANGALLSIQESELFQDIYVSWFGETTD